MQLYVLDHDPARAVQFLADVHVIKMCLETVQIISGAIVNSGGSPFAGMPRSFNPAHPVIRAVDTSAKLNWILLYNWLLQCEFLFRFRKHHAYFDLSILCFEKLWSPHSTADCSGLARTFKNFSTPETDLVLAFRAYYRFKKTQISRWKYTRRPEPAWLAG